MSSSSFNRPGAIDLSASWPSGPSRRSSRPRHTGPSRHRRRTSIEVTEQTFEAETIRRSLKHPVVVELYSPRVATGQQLSDALSDIANASDGQVPAGPDQRRHGPGIVQALGLQAVPTVIALHRRSAAPLFQGVLPKDQVQAAIDQLLKAAVANGIVGRAEPWSVQAEAPKSPTSRRRPTPGSPRRTRPRAR